MNFLDWCLFTKSKLFNKPYITLAELRKANWMYNSYCSKKRLPIQKYKDIKGDMFIYGYEETVIKINKKCLRVLKQK